MNKTYFHKLIAFRHALLLAKRIQCCSNLYIQVTMLTRVLRVLASQWALLNIVTSIFFKHSEGGVSRDVISKVL